MPLTSTAALTTIVEQARAFVRTRFRGRGVNDAQFLGKQAHIQGMALLGVQRTLEAIDRDSPPNSKSSKNGLTSWAFTIGVPSNAGGYGPNAATVAGGGQAPVTGTPGTHVNAGQQLFAPDGVTVLQLLDPGGGFGVIPFTGNFVAVTPGVVGNIAAGESLSWISPPAGCDGAVVLSVGLSGGLDAEEPAHLLDRTLTRLQVPPKGGANVDFKSWAEAIAGVFTCYVFPRRAGTGTVDVVVVAQGSGTGRKPGTTVVNLVKAFYASIAPTNIETINVYEPYMPAGQGLTIRVRAVPTPKYAWDWNDTAVNLNVAGYNAGTPSLTLNTAAPADLIAAIASGLKPRIQVINTSNGAPVVPDTRQVIAIDGTNTILTLSSALSVAPTNTDKVYAGSYFAHTAAVNGLAYLDELGPSRLSGLADNINVWDDVVSNMAIGGTVRDTFDTDGVTRMVDRVLLNGVTIAIGSGAASVQDYEPVDNGINAPQLAYATRFYVTQ